MSGFRYQDLTIHFHDAGAGVPVVFQHGLGGDLTVPCGLFRPPNGVRLISFDARFHGETQPLCDPAKLNFDTFADDLLALLDYLEIEKAVVGGISMGAGLALNFAIRYPERTLGLILSRPAWLDKPFPENVRMFPIMATFIRQMGWREGLEAFKTSPTYADVLAQSTDSAAALVGMFENPLAEETVDKLERIPACCPSTKRSDWKSIAVPTLVLGNDQDPIHPLFMAENLSTTIPGATLRLLTPKCISITEHGVDVQKHMTEFLATHFLQSQG
jgi:pimeloyl-ACP methyl ester carboxylesterase